MLSLLSIYNELEYPLRLFLYELLLLLVNLCENIMSDKVYRSKKGTKKRTWCTKRTNVSNRRPLNRYEVIEEESENVSTAAKKLKLSKDNYDIEVNDTFGYRLISFVTVFTALSEYLVCKQCGTNVTFTETSKRGLGFKLVITCQKCEKVYINSCPLIINAYEINRRIIFAMRLLGIGLNGLIKFCAFMDLPRPILQTTYTSIINNTLIATEAVRIRSIKKAAEDEKKLSIEKGQTNGITVSGDGSWKKRGFSSLYGLAALIGWCTGKVVDVLVKSKYCKSCQLWKKKEDTAQYEEWAESHTMQCHSNHEGSSGKMEVDAIIEMFSRSEALHNVKYINYIGDGDSKTFKGITDAKLYNDVTVCKKECINHIQKRMGTRLRNLKKNMKSLGGKGKLTGVLIDELALYYGLAIRRHPDSIENMQQEIWATLYHKLSTDDVPQHDMCPIGADSWCRWQKAKASNNLRKYRHKKPMSQDIFNIIKPVYEDLSKDDLLNRCLGGFTQNNNESFNAMVWSISPKTTSSGKTVIEIAANIATSIFNDGFLSIMEVMQVLGLIVGHQCYSFCIEADARRVQAANRSLTDAAQEARRASTSSRKLENEENINMEGQLYGAGIAD